MTACASPKRALAPMFPPIGEPGRPRMPLGAAKVALLVE